MRIMLANLAKMAGDSGGLAKVACAFATEMARRGHDLALAYSDENPGGFFYPIDPCVARFNLNDAGNGRMIRFPLRLKLLREILRCVDKRQARAVNDLFQSSCLKESLRSAIGRFKPEIIVAFQPASTRLLLDDLGTKLPVITMSHGDPADYFRSYPVKELPAIEACAMNQVLMPSFEAALKAGLPRARTVTIGNAIRQMPFTADLAAQKPVRRIVTVGRLTQNHKRPHLLIEAFARVAGRHPDWRLELWGDKDRDAYYRRLESMIRDSGLSGRAFLMGPTKDVPAVLKEADLFAFPSAYEGFGMALAEGMSAGLPAIGFKSCPAVNELIEDGVTGLLCEDGAEALAGALDRLMSDQALRVQMGAAAKAAMQAFAPERIWDRWESLIQEVIESFKPAPKRAGLLGEEAAPPPPLLFSCLPPSGKPAQGPAGQGSR